MHALTGHFLSAKQSPKRYSLAIGFLMAFHTLLVFHIPLCLADSTKRSGDFETMLSDLELLSTDNDLVSQISRNTLLIREPQVANNQTQITVENPKKNSNESDTTSTSGATSPGSVAQKTVNPAQKSKEYWTVLHALESSSGKRIYKRSNRARSCQWTKSPCGHHQLSYIALKEIGCTSLKCRKAREDFDQSLKMSKQLQVINKKRLKRLGHSNLPDYQIYLAHQQGVSGISRILHAASGKKNLTRKNYRYMAANSPFNSRHLKRLGSRKAAQKFLDFWENRWNQKNRRLVASQ